MDGSGVVSRGDPIRVAEFGFGAAINFSLTVMTLRRLRPGASLQYVAVDREPVGAQDLPVVDEGAHRLAVTASETGDAAGEGVTLRVRQAAFETFETSDPFDAVYFDPFGPTQQPHSWSVAAFVAAARAMKPDARLVTYSAAGWVRRNMAAAGLYVATADGPPTKRHFTVASPTPTALAPWPVRNEPQ